jgi:RNA polymerase sigma factor (sigma-70 family)
MASRQAGTVLRHLRRLVAAPAGPERTDRELLHAFCTANDQAAFATLVRRHGPLVWGLCRHGLGHEQDAEDAFQATFLVLARKAASIRKGEALVSFLYGVAHRTVMSAKRNAARRRAHEGRAHDTRQVANPAWEAAWREVQALLDEEIQRLPEKYRAPFLMCCLENHSREEAARLLGVAEGTVWSRLTRARRLLQRKLDRHGVALPAALAAVALSRRTGRAVAAPLLHAALQASFATTPALVTDLARGVLKDMTLARARAITGFLLALTVALTGVGLLTRLAAQAEPPAPPPQPSPAAGGGLGRGATARPNDQEKEVVVSGRVLGPDGKPVAGARLYLDFDRKDMDDLEAYLMTEGRPKEPALPVRATSDTDGRFRFAFRCAEQETAAASVLPRMVAAFADGHGFDLDAAPAGKGREITLRLTKPQPIFGRILDQDHNPVRGARVRVIQVRRYTPAGLSRYLDGVRSGVEAGGFLGEKNWLRPLPAEPVRTGPDGRFRLTGLGPDCVAMLGIEGPGIEHGTLNVMTRAGEPVQAAEGSPHDAVYGATFEYVARVGRRIRGTIRDRDSGRALAGVRLAAWGLSDNQAFSDREGRYELLGVAKVPRYHLVAYPMRGQPYFLEEVAVADERGVGPITADIALTRGALLEGRLTDAETGKPLPGAVVEYYPLSGNSAALKVIHGFRNQPALAETLTRSDGSYGLAVLPGPGVVAVRSGILVSRYMPPLVTAQELHAFFKGSAFKGDDLKAIRGVGDEFTLGQVDYHALVLLNPAERAESLRRDVALETGRAIRATLVGPDGKPVTGARVEGLGDWPELGMPLSGADFTLKHVNPRRKVELIVRHKEKGLSAVCLVRGDEKGLVTIRLARCGSVAGRLLDRDGQPARGVVLWIHGKKDDVFGRLARVTTDGEGRYRFDGLVPGQEHMLLSGSGGASYSAQGPLVVQPGQVRTVEDLKPLGDN